MVPKLLSNTSPIVRLKAQIFESVSRSKLVATIFSDADELLNLRSDFLVPKSGRSICGEHAFQCFIHYVLVKNLDGEPGSRFDLRHWRLRGVSEKCIRLIGV